MARTVIDRLPWSQYLFAAAAPARATSRGRPSMRIGLIAPPGVPVPPPAYGGTESVIDRLARGLLRAGHEVLLAAAANSACPVPRVGGTDEAAEAGPPRAPPVPQRRPAIPRHATL